MNNETGIQDQRQFVCSECRRAPYDSVADYYWRDYTGVIPYDAVHGGRDINHKTTYIGQGFYSRAGLLTGTIYPERSGIKLPHNGSNNSEIGVKILCSPYRDLLTWEKAESGTLHLTTIEKHLVIGGYEDGKIINVGRAMYQGELVVGKVQGFETEKAKLWFVHGDKEISVNSYQVLIYNNN